MENENLIAKEKGRNIPISGNVLNFFARCWRGELPLWLTYWAMGVGGLTVVSVGAGAFVGGIIEGGIVDPKNVRLSYWLIYGPITGYRIFAAVSIFRAARNYEGFGFWRWLSYYTALMTIVWAAIGVYWGLWGELH